MSEQDPEVAGPRDAEPRVIEHGEQKSITGSAQGIGIEPGDDFVAPTMALDTLDQDTDD